MCVCMSVCVHVRVRVRVCVRARVRVWCTDEVPSFEAETCSMLDFLQSHRGHLASAQTLRYQ